MENSTQKSKVLLVKNWLGSGSIDLFGYPFAGKDTHGRDLARLFDGPLIGGGDILRSPTMPVRIHKLISTGELLPTKDYLEIVLPHLNRPEFADKPLILSSVGRWHGEEAGVLEATAESGHPLRIVIFLEISEAEIWQRWRSDQSAADRGDRSDDAAGKLAVRLREFQTKTLPVIQFYREQNLLISVDGRPSKQTVLTDILSQLCQVAERSMK